MSRRLLVLVLLTAALALVGSGPAAARVTPRSLLPPDLMDTAVGAPVADEPGFLAGFRLDPPGPYEVRVGTEGEAVVVSIIRGNPRKRAAASHYLARGVAGPERLRATFGRLGQISMRFRESRHRPWFGKKRRCRGAGRFVVRRGVFVGNFKFRGEDGRLKLRVHRAKGSITTVAAKCRRGDRHREARSSSVFEDTLSGLIATDREGVDATVFGAISIGGRLFYVAQREEAKGKLAVLRMAIVLTHGDLPLNEAATAGRFSPGTPFHGAGRYRAAPDGSTTWLGGLSVDFPGVSRFPLAGPGYETFIEAGL
jgi:hypothetical protein